MFKRSLLDNYALPALTNSEGKMITNGGILRKISSYISLFEVLRVSADDTVGIHSKDEANVISSIIASMCYGCNLSILHYNEDTISTRVKMRLSKVNRGFLLSDEHVVDEDVLTIHPDTFIVTNKNQYYYALENESIVAKGNLYSALRHIRTIHEDKSRIQQDITEDSYGHLPAAYLSEGKRNYIFTFHKGLDKGLHNAAMINHESVYKGILNAKKELPYKAGKRLACVEPMDHLYDIVNGVIAPMLNRVHVITKETATINQMGAFIKKYKPEYLYTNGRKWAWFLEGFLERELPLLKMLKFVKPLYWTAMTLAFNKKLGSGTSHVVLRGKLYRHALLNSISKRHTVLYTMNEVTSFIGKNSFRWIPKGDINYKCNDIRDIAINCGKNSKDGEIMAYTNDSLDCYLTITQTKKALFEHGYKGRLRTGDIGYIKGGELYVMGSAKSIFHNENNVIIETGKLVTLALRSKYVREANVFRNDENQLCLLIEPELSEAIIGKITPEVLKVELAKLVSKINSNVSPSSRIKKHVVYSDPKGLIRKNFKIISFHF